MYHAHPMPFLMPLGPWIEDTLNNYSKKKIYLSLFINHVIIVKLSYIRFKVNFTPEKNQWTLHLTRNNECYLYNAKPNVGPENLKPVWVKGSASTQKSIYIVHRNVVKSCTSLCHEGTRTPLLVYYGYKHKEMKLVYNPVFFFHRCQPSVMPVVCCCKSVTVKIIQSSPYVHSLG